METVRTRIHKNSGMETGNIVWTGSPDDQTAVFGEYKLRCEKIHTRLWWWCVYYKYDTQEITQPLVGHEKIEYVAKQSAENAYRKHLKKNEL